MNLFFFKRAVQDILNNRFLNTVTVITIALSVLIVSSFALFFTNANELLDTWKRGIRALVYLDPTANDANRLDLKYNIQQLAGVSEAHFISRAVYIIPFVHSGPGPGWGRGDDRDIRALYRLLFHLPEVSRQPFG